MNKEYYKQMLLKNRLFSYRTKQGLVCFITFYLGTKNDEDKFIRDDMWQVLGDNPDGNICFIDQLLTSKNPENPKLSYRIWNDFKWYIKENFKNVEIIRHNRFKQKWGEPKIFKEGI